jgi:hypothetical protein
MVQHLHYGTNRSRFWIVGAINQAADARMQYRTRTHGARFNCNKQVAGRKAMVTQGDSSLAQGDDFGVGGGIFIEDVAIPSPAHDAVFMHHHSSDGHFACFQRSLGRAQSFLHPKFVVGGPGICGHRDLPVCVALLARLKYSGWRFPGFERTRSDLGRYGRHRGRALAASQAAISLPPDRPARVTGALVIFEFSTIIWRGGLA